jgi:hypothetical protein
MSWYFRHLLFRLVIFWTIFVHTVLVGRRTLAFRSSEQPQAQTGAGGRGCDGRTRSQDPARFRLRVLVFNHVLSFFLNVNLILYTRQHRNAPDQAENSKLSKSLALSIKHCSLHLLLCRGIVYS